MMSNLNLGLEIRDFDLERMGFSLSVLDESKKRQASEAYLRMTLLELHAFLTAELNERLRMQIERLVRLHHDLEQLSQQRTPASEMARAVRELLEALRLWYAEIELAAGGIHRKDIGTQADQLLGRIEHSVLEPDLCSI